ncbi:MAG: PASTA domain-containing protein [Spirochaetales bacterium]|nr:PASTA domain-containing protein [Spirochaetales bacterium]
MPELLEKKRLLIFGAFLGICTLVLTGFLFSLMVVNSTGSQDRMEDLRGAERGPILDRNGVELALQPELYYLEAWIPHVENINESATILSNVLMVSRESILNKFVDRTGSVVIAHQVTPGDSQKIENYKAEDKLKGIYLKPKMGRIYPQQELASHVIGYVNVDNKGSAGVEYTLDKELQPSSQNIGVLYGNQVILTVDITLQYKMDTIARKAFENSKAESVMILAMEAKTGEILSYSSIPNYDPNEYSKFSDLDRMNRPVAMAYEPGSVFKIFSMASLLELGAITTEDHFYCNGSFEKQVGNELVKIKCLDTHGDVGLQEILKYSCNAGAAYASEKAASVPFYDKLYQFGFGQKTGIQLAGESYGIFNPVEKWSSRSKPTIGFGQEISVSAIQMITAATVFANKGKLLKPHIVRRIVSPDGKRIIRDFPREEVRQVTTASTALKILSLMEAATETGGTATAAAIAGIRIASKTGTAQVPDLQHGGYSAENYIASILGLFPAEDPQIILYIVIQNPKEGSIFGSRIAAPLFKQATEEILFHYDIPKQNDPSYVYSGEIKIPVPMPVKIGNTMPNLKGVPKRLLLPLIEEGFDIDINGEGYVVKQDPPPGAAVTKGMKITVYLK